MRKIIASERKNEGMPAWTEIKGSSIARKFLGLPPEDDEVETVIDKESKEMISSATKARLSGYPEDAIRIRLKLKEKMPNNLDNKYNLALAYFDARQFENMITTINDILKDERNLKSPLIYSIYILLGDSNFLIFKNLDQAEKAYTKSLEAYATNIRANYGLGCIYLKREDYQRAVSAFKKCSELDFSFTDGLVLLGYAYGNLKQYEDAIYYLERTLELSPDHPSAKKYLDIYRIEQKINI